MAKKKKAVDEAITGPVPGTVVLVNLDPSEKDIALYNGVNVHLAPFKRGGAGHISSPIPRKLIPEAVRKMERRGWIKIKQA